MPLLREMSSSKCHTETKVEVDFLANNPGLTLFHCHQQLHMVSDSWFCCTNSIVKSCWDSLHVLEPVKNACRIGPPRGNQEEFRSDIFIDGYL